MLQPVVVRSLRCGARVVRASVLRPAAGMAGALSVVPARGTWVMKRRYDLPRSPQAGPPRELREPTDYTYEVLYNTNKLPTPPLTCIITQDVENIGLKGDIVAIEREIFRSQLYPAGQAVYMSEENLSEYAEDIGRRRGGVAGDKQAEPRQQQQQQTVGGFTTAASLRRLTLTIPMSADNPWCLQRGHVTQALRRAGYQVPDACMGAVPEDVTHQHIYDFATHIVVNQLDEVEVRCHVVLYSKEDGLIEPLLVPPPASPPTPATSDITNSS